MIWDAVRKNAHAMLRYLDYLTTKIHPDGLVAFGLGDWCPAGRGCGDYLAPLELTDSIMAMDICRKAAEMFRRIGRQKQSAFAAELADAFRQSIRSNLIDWETMLVKGNCQTSQARRCISMCSRKRNAHRRLRRCGRSLRLTENA